MSLVDEIKEIVEIRINEKVLSDKLFNKAVMPLLEKITKDIIPTDIDDALLASKKDMLEAFFFELMNKAVDKVEEKTGLELDGQE